MQAMNEKTSWARRVFSSIDADHLLLVVWHKKTPFILGIQQSPPLNDLKTELLWSLVYLLNIPGSLPV